MTIGNRGKSPFFNANEQKKATMKKHKSKNSLSLSRQFKKLKKNSLNEVSQNLYSRSMKKIIKPTKKSKTNKKEILLKSDSEDDKKILIRQETPVNKDKKKQTFKQAKSKFSLDSNPSDINFKKKIEFSDLQDKRLSMIRQIRAQTEPNQTEAESIENLKNFLTFNSELSTPQSLDIDSISNRFVSITGSNLPCANNVKNIAKPIEYMFDQKTQPESFVSVKNELNIHHELNLSAIEFIPDLNLFAIGSWNSRKLSFYSADPEFYFDFISETDSFLSFNPSVIKYIEALKMLILGDTFSNMVLFR